MIFKMIKLTPDSVYITSQRQPPHYPRSGGFHDIDWWPYQEPRRVVTQQQSKIKTTLAIPQGRLKTSPQRHRNTTCDVQWRDSRHGTDCLIVPPATAGAITNK